MPPLDETFVREFMVRNWEAWNSHDPERVLSLMTPDVVYRDAAWPTTMRGHGDVRAFMVSMWRGVPDLAFESIDGPFLHPTEPRAAERFRGTCTNTGTLDPPGFAPTGRRAEFEGMGWYEFRGNLLCRLSYDFNLTEISQQLGLAPSPGSRMERAAVRLQRLRTRFSSSCVSGEFGRRLGGRWPRVSDERRLSARSLSDLRCST